VSRQLRLPAGGETRTHITLRPDGLGTVEIDLTTDPSGRLSVLLRVENPAVLQALRADRDLLLTSLDQTGRDLGGAQLDFEGFGTGSEPRSDGDGRRSGPYQAGRDAGEMTALPAGTTARAPLIGGGRIDLFT
jgi:flagellar hook-length control protein FliK